MGIYQLFTEWLKNLLKRTETSNEKYEQSIDSEFVLKIKLINSNANEKKPQLSKEGKKKVNPAKVKIKIQNKEQQQCH